MATHFLQHIWSSVKGRIVKPVPQLPLDVYPLIFEQVCSTRDLHTLLFVSSFFRYEAERALYQTIALSEASTNDIYIHVHLFHHLAKCVRVASHVRQLDMAAVSYTYLYDFPLEFSKTYWKDLHSAIRALKNLKVLRVVMHPIFRIRGSPSDMPPCLLSDCTFQLQRLNVIHLRPEDIGIVSQQGIFDLDIGATQSKGVFPRKSFPNLQILACNSFYARQLVHLPIKALHLRKVTSFHGLPVSETVRSLQNYPCEGEDPATFLRIFPSLRYLRVHISHNSDETMRKLAQALIQSTYLKKLHISQYGLIMWKPDSKTMFSSISLLFATIQTLEVVTVDFGDVSGIEWVRGSSTGTLAIFDTDEWKKSCWF